MRWAAWALVSLGCAGAATPATTPVVAASVDHCEQGTVICCVVGERRSCADAALSGELGALRADTVQITNAGISFESDHLTRSSPDLSHYEEGTVVLHWLDVDGDALTHAGSITLGSIDVSEEWQPPEDGDDPGLHRGLESDDVRLTWTYAIRGACCIEILAVAQRAVRRHGGETTTEVTELELGPAPPELPRIAGGEDEALWSSDRVVDRRGLWRLEPDRWRRVDRCDAR